MFLIGSYCTVHHHRIKEPKDNRLEPRALYIQLMAPGIALKHPNISELVGLNYKTRMCPVCPHQTVGTTRLTLRSARC